MRVSLRRDGTRWSTPRPGTSTPCGTTSIDRLGRDQLAQLAAISDSILENVDPGQPHHGADDRRVVIPQAGTGVPDRASAARTSATNASTSSAVWSHAVIQRTSPTVSSQS